MRSKKIVVIARSEALCGDVRFLLETRMAAYNCVGVKVFPVSSVEEAKAVLAEHDIVLVIAERATMALEIKQSSDVPVLQLRASRVPSYADFVLGKWDPAQIVERAQVLAVRKRGPKGPRKKFDSPAGCGNNSLAQSPENAVA